ncbi:MAG: cytochrome c [Caldilineaceae bacterium]|nr:cytochrome c [Caldilineaceae bacterium]
MTHEHWTLPRRLFSRRPRWSLALPALVVALTLAACAPVALPAPPAAEEDTAATVAETAAPEETVMPEETAAPEETVVAEETAVVEETAVPVEESALPAGDAAAGEYIFNAAMGCGCHFNRDLGALAGGNAFEGDFGVVYSRNLTPDATGIAGLSDLEVADSIRFGKRAGGGALFIMPHFSAMADQDAANLVAYLRSLEPVANEIPDRQLGFEPEFAMPATLPPAVAPTEGPDRGQYLASLVRCGMCHTPANEDGSPDMDLFLAGAPFRDTVAPNLTPDEATGLGLWTEEEIADFLATGVYSDGFEAHAGMKRVVDNATGKLTDADRLAIAQWLKSLPAVQNEPATP